MSLTPLGKMGLEAQNQGLPVYSLEMKRIIPEPKALFKYLL